jgi:hypothetical protein
VYTSSLSAPRGGGRRGESVRADEEELNPLGGER